MTILYFLNPSIVNSGFSGEVGPAAHDFNDALNYLFCTCLLDVSRLGKGEQVITLKPISLTIHAHLVLTRPLTTGIPRVGNIEGGRQAPFTPSIHEEGYVLDVIITIPTDYIENSSQHLLLHVLSRESHPPNDLDRLLVRIAC